MRQIVLGFLCNVHTYNASRGAPGGKIRVEGRKGVRKRIRAENCVWKYRGANGRNLCKGLGAKGSKFVYAGAKGGEIRV